ncbi:MAG: hypothetical protein LCH80_05525 [Proteobacteria bacterium]|nr:hypothetical protein [Pseudomonadota bacterium]
MKRKMTLVLFGAWAVALISPVSAQSSKVVNVIKMAAWAQVFAEKCPRLDVNWTRYGAIMSVAGLKPEDIEPAGKHGKLHGAFIAEALNETKGSSDSVVCATALTLYGRNGRNVPGLLAPKD